jgi:uncharacterized protein (DUF1800 family)
MQSCDSMSEQSVVMNTRGRPSWAEQCSRGVGVAMLAMALSACGGGGGGSASSSGGTQDSGAQTGGGSGDVGAPVPVPVPPIATPQRDAAARFLTQASFGPDEASVDRVIALGYEGWIDEQLRLPATSHLATWDALDAALKAENPNAWPGQDGVTNSFWRAAVTADDQLRQRVALALSEIFVVSMQDTVVGNDPRSVASYLDLLATRGLGRYRDLLQGVATHPSMGRYLSMLGNRKADTRTGRVPDENFAREVMQLFSIGLYQLNLDGSPKLDGGAPVDTYGPTDITGLARVFTGWSWACPVAPTTANATCFSTGNTKVGTASSSDADRSIKSMINYPGMHAPEEKRFLSAVIPANTDGPTSLRIALDTLAGHPNVGPFIGRQLIQRLVTSNPSPAYVRDVAQAFNASGGDLKAMVKAILLHPEARNPATGAGKVREPLLRLSAFLRAFHATSDSGQYKIGNTDDPNTKLGQTPMRAPSVFNFFRPGYAPPGVLLNGVQLVSPELQMTHEATAAGYVNYVRHGISFGFGPNGGAPLNRLDIQPDYRAEMALADKPAVLMDQIDTKLMYGTMPAALKIEIANAIATISITNSNPVHVENGKRVRVNAAVFLTMVSPEFLVQK